VAGIGKVHALATQCIVESSKNESDESIQSEVIEKQVIKREESSRVFGK
jgi:hypothetical protein